MKNPNTARVVVLYMSEGMDFMYPFLLLKHWVRIKLSEWKGPKGES